MNSIEKWDHRFMAMAELISTWSKDPSTKCGAIIVDSKKRIIGSGYNGFPIGVEDSRELLNNRDNKYIRVIHGEENALLFASKTDLSDCTIYVWPLPPCGNCMAKIIQKGIRRVVTIEPTLDQLERWGLSFEAAMDMARQTNTSVNFL